VLDPEPIALGYGSHVAVAGRVDDYLVANGGWDVLARRWSAATGAALDPAPFPVSRAANNEYSPAAARGGDTILVAWVDERRVGEAWIYAARVRSDGTRLDTAAIPVDRLELFDYRYDHRRHAIKVVSDGTDFVVAWTEVTDAGVHIFGARISGQGEMLGGPFLLGPATEELGSPQIVFGGDGYALLWLTGDANTVRLRRFTAALEPIGQRDFGSFYQPYGAFRPLLAATAEHFLVIFRTEAQCSAQRFGFDGALIGAEVLTECGYGLIADPSGGSFLVLDSGAGAEVIDERGAKQDAYGAGWGFPYDQLSGTGAQHDGSRYALAYGTIERTNDPSQWWPQTRRRDLGIAFASAYDGSSCLSIRNLTPTLVPVADGPTDEVSPAIVPGDRPAESIVLYAIHDPELDAFRIVGRSVTPQAADFAGSVDEGCYPESSQWGCRAADPAGSSPFALLVGIGLWRLARRLRPNPATRRCCRRSCRR
jgi:hypothetical protein